MKISEVKARAEGTTYEKEIDVLENIYRQTGDCAESGFLGFINDIYYDDYGHIEFETNNQVSDLKTRTVGAVLDGSVIIKQVQENKTNKFAQMFSWKKDGSSYTYVAFDNEKVMNHAYISIKKFHPEFLGENIDRTFLSLGVPFDNIMDVKLSQKVKSSVTATSMVSEVSNNSSEDSNSFSK